MGLHSRISQASLIFAISQAENKGQALEIDTNSLEDEYLLHEIKRRETEVLARAGPVGNGVRRAGQLGKVRAGPFCPFASPQNPVSGQRGTDLAPAPARL